MPTHPSEMFVYDNIYFENGHKDTAEHPVVIAGIDSENAYCFAMTSQIKHIGKNSQARNLYNSTIKYVETIPNKNCHTNNNLRGLVNTTQCIIVPLEEARNYPRFGFATGNLLKEIVTRWLFQQNEIQDKKQYGFNEICTALGIDSSILYSPLYKQCQDLMQEYPNELQLQREYAHDLRIYREECTKVRRQNTNNIYRGGPHIPYPREPRLKDDKSYFEQYASPQYTEEEIVKNSPFAGLAEQLFGPSVPKEEKKDTVIDFESRKKELMELKQMLQESQSQEQGSEQEIHHGRRAA